MTTEKRLSIVANTLIVLTAVAAAAFLFYNALLEPIL